MREKTKKTSKAPSNVGVYHAKWLKETKKRFEIRVDVKKESDIIEYLASKNNFQSYIKELIRKDIKETKV